MEGGRDPTEDIIHYFTLMSSELHYLDMIPKIGNLTLMSSASGKITYLTPIFLWFCPYFSYSVTFITLVSSCRCRFTHFCRWYVASCIYVFSKNWNLIFACFWRIFLIKKFLSLAHICLKNFQPWIYIFRNECENFDIIFDNLDIIF